MAKTSHPQDDLLIVEALIHLGHDLEDLDPERSKQAWDLAVEVADEHGLYLRDAVLQIQRRKPID